jgi:hypothetical protein
MMAVQLVLGHFEDILQESRVLLRCDNSTMVSYFNREGRTKSFQLCCLIWEIFQWSKSIDIVIRAAHIPGKYNVLADDLSRGRLGLQIIEWSLKQEIVNQIFLQFSTLTIDLFATRENKKLPVFCSPFFGSFSWGGRCTQCDIERNVCTTSFDPTSTAEDSDGTMYAGGDCLSVLTLPDSLGIQFY